MARCLANQGSKREYAREVRLPTTVANRPAVVTPAAKGVASIDLLQLNSPWADRRRPPAEASAVNSSCRSTWAA
ncbi:hypothetical protein [Leptolyngbya sp. KIOST-1]|uniref:hypothetical protein n=1 Tax=Leptolyngbya sp. KIOST-1 TaxID=1229172 RepID=UPI0012E0616D|nr:hypothetical protein [Leptolyngbya sp. KIOST-1]